MLARSFYVGLVFSVFVLLQLWMLFTQQLFGDEAFYWLEGQYLGLSYSELPGWTAWMTRLGTEIFGNNYFAVRIISYLGFLSIFRTVWLINNRIRTPLANNFLLLLAIPIFTLIGVMALPDVWLLVFVMWIVVFFMKAVTSNKYSDWLVLGVVIACGINVHVRLWIWLFIAGLAFLVVYKKQLSKLKPLFFLTLPIALLGFLPIFWFNVQNEYALFVFQFGQRHPWEFQIGNLSFLLSQLIVVTPLVLLLWFNHIFKSNNKQPLVKWITLTAGLHWLLYVVLSLFADGFRTTVHWVLISYVPVLAISGVWLEQNKVLYKWAIRTGLLWSLGLLMVMNFNIGNGSNIKSRILDNSTGWKDLSTAVKRIGKEQATDNVIADYFMTGAELSFELGIADSIKVLPHEKNIKHGRHKQLEVMGILLDKPLTYKDKALLIVEDTTLKLKNKGKYYQQLCNDFKSLEWLESVNILQTGKLFHVFIVNASEDKSIENCSVPPLFYAQYEKEQGNLILLGWVLLHNHGVGDLKFISGCKTIAVTNNRISNSGVAVQFPEVNDENNPNVGYEIEVSLEDITDNRFQLMAIGKDNKTYYSQIYYLD